MRPTAIRQIAVNGFVMVWGIGLAAWAAACPICIGFPDKTDADVLLDGCCVLLGRSDPVDPFQYAPGVVLKGAYDGSDFDLLVDSATRRVLQTYSDSHVLLVQDSPHGPWRNMGPISRAFESVVRRIVMVGPTWIGSNATKHRIEFFLPLVGHDDDRIRELAYLELGRAPYPVVRQLGRVVARDAYEPMLLERRYFEWRGLAILLLAQSHAESDRQYIRESFQSAEQFAVVTHLAAWAAAAIEVDPFSTLEQIETKYFGPEDRTPEELQAIFRALSMHGSLAEPELRDRIVVSYGRLLDCLPQLAPQVAEDLYAWNRTELTDVLANISDQRKVVQEQSEIYKIQRYLRSTMIAESTGRLHD